MDTRSFYGADDRLRAFQKYDDVLGSIQSTRSGVWEEYRYDGLGRRVAVRTLRPNELCSDTSACYNSTTYFVWAGDQLLWEIREAPNAAVEHANGMVSYFQAGGIDRPLTIWKDGIGTVVTHQNWRGQFARGTFGVGARAGQSSDCTEYPATNGCIPVRWPGWNTTAWSQEAAKPATTGSEEFWFGSLSGGDAGRKRAAVHAQPLLQPADGAVYAAGSDRTGGWAEQLRLCGGGSGHACRSERTRNSDALR